MSDRGARTLESELGGRVPEGLDGLGDEQLIALARLLKDAKRRQSDALQIAVEEALNVVPRLLRGPVRKVLFG